MTRKKIAIRYLCVVLSVLALGYASCYFISHVKTLYFLMLHKPFSFAQQTYTPHIMNLPKFIVSVDALSPVTPTVNEKLIVHIQSLEHTSAFVHVWVTTPHSREIRKETLNNQMPIDFTQNYLYVHTLDWPITSDLSRGTYTVGVQITSVQGFTDYFFNNHIQQIIIN